MTEPAQEGRPFQVGRLDRRSFKRRAKPLCRRQRKAITPQSPARYSGVPRERHPPPRSFFDRWSPRGSDGDHLERTASDQHPRRRVERRGRGHHVVDEQDRPAGDSTAPAETKGAARAAQPGLAVERALRWRGPSASQSRDQRQAQSGGQRLSDRSRLIKATSPAAAPVERNRHHTVALTQFTAQPLGHTVGEMTPQVLQPLKLEAANHRVDRRPVDPRGPQPLKGRWFPAACTAQIADRQVSRGQRPSTPMASRAAGDHQATATRQAKPKRVSARPQRSAAPQAAGGEKPPRDGIPHRPEPGRTPTERAQPCDNEQDHCVYRCSGP